MRRSLAVRGVTLSCCALVGVIAVLPTPSSATIIRYGDGTGNITAPTDDPGWANVGSVTGGTNFGSAVYLGNRWVLTAAHVGVGSVLLGSQLYDVEPGTWHRLHTPGDPGTNVDLGLFRLTETPLGLPDLAISQSAPPNTSEVVGIGYGRNRAASESDWDTHWNPVSPPGDYSGFYYGSGNTKRWGTNNIDDFGSVVNTWGDTSTLNMTFDESGDFEMQVANGDSGGGLFYKNGSDWELAGIIIARTSYGGDPDHGIPDQPYDTVAYGNRSLAADLSEYRGQIMLIIPEPSTLVMLLSLGAGCLVWSIWRRNFRPAR